MSDDEGDGDGSNEGFKLPVFLVGGLVGAYLVYGWLEGQTPDETLWNSVYGLVGGAIALVLAFKHLRDHQLMRNTPTSKVRSIAVGGVEVEGRARPVEEPLVSPLTRSEACAYQLEVERKWESDDKAVWETVLELDRRPPFRIDDGTDQVLVDAEDAEFEVEKENRVHVYSNHPPPAKLQAWAADHDIGGDGEAENEKEGPADAITDVGETIGEVVVDVVQGTPEEHLTEGSLFERRYTERVVGVDETTYVLGGAYPRNGAQDPDNADNLVIREHEGTGEFIVSDRPEQALADAKLGRIALFFAAAFALIPPAIFRALLALSGG